MNLQQAYFITEVLAGIAFIVSIVFVALQLRQNSYLLRKSMAHQRHQRIGLLHETLRSNNDFRAFHRRIDTDWQNFNEV